MTALQALKCGKCGNEIEECAFCDVPICPSPICNTCLALVLRERVASPSSHSCRQAASPSLVPEQS